MLLQVTEAADGFTKLFDYSVSLGVLGLMIIGLGYALNKLWRERKDREEAFSLVLAAKDNLILAKDNQITEMNKDDKLMITEVTKTMTELRASFENTNNNFMSKLNEIHTDVKKMV